MSARYEPVQLPADDCGRVSWGIIDHQAPGPDKVVRDPDSDSYEAYWDRRGAEDWIARQTYLDGARIVSR